MDLIQSCQNLKSYLKSSDVKTIWILVGPLWLLYTYRDTQVGSKLTTFSQILLLSQHPVHPNIECADPEGGGANVGAPLKP